MTTDHFMLALGVMPDFIMLKETNGQQAAEDKLKVEAVSDKKLS
jgi:hypothetical protein